MPNFLAQNVGLNGIVTVPPSASALKTASASSTVYFDLRSKQDLPYASPIQVFLECSAGDKLEQETANQVRDLILRELKE